MLAPKEMPPQISEDGHHSHLTCSQAGVCGMFREQIVTGHSLGCWAQWWSWKEWREQEQIRCGPRPHVQSTWRGRRGGQVVEPRIPGLHWARVFAQALTSSVTLGKLPNVLYSGERRDQIPIAEERPPSHSRKAFTGRNWSGGGQLVSPASGLS